MSKPDYVDKNGKEYYLNKPATNYAKELGLKNVQVFDVNNMRLIVQDKVPIFENSNLEAIATHLEMMSMVK